MDLRYIQMVIRPLWKTDEEANGKDEGRYQFSFKILAWSCLLNPILKWQIHDSTLRSEYCTLQPKCHHSCELLSSKSINSLFLGHFCNKPCSCGHAARHIHGNIF